MKQHLFKLITVLVSVATLFTFSFAPYLQAPNTLYFLFHLDYPVKA